MLKQGGQNAISFAHALQASTKTPKRNFVRFLRIIPLKLLDSIDEVANNHEKHVADGLSPRASTLATSSTRAVSQQVRDYLTRDCERTQCS